LSHGWTITALVGEGQPLQSRVSQFVKLGGGVIDPTSVSYFLKVSGADGVILPPCFLLQVKEQVACMENYREGCHNPPFLV